MTYLSFLFIAQGLLISANAEDYLLFQREQIGQGIYESASVFDVNNDGILDIFSGEFWYEGPDFKKSHRVCVLQPIDDYYDDFSNYPMDVNGDGYLDIITGGWWGETLRWRENPQGKDELWQTHEIAKVGNIERPLFCDLDKDGIAEIIPITRPVLIFKLKLAEDGKPAGEFVKYEIKTDGAGGHGAGSGDVDGDGNIDLLFAGGWLKSPPDPYSLDAWEWFPEWNLGSASIPILVHDVDKDGKNDIIVGAAHDYGLFWYQQKVSADGKRSWERHIIDEHRSQYHDMKLQDIDNDGELELITGKRYRAHAFHDPGSKDPLGVYYFKVMNGAFKRFTLDYGPAGKASGVGIYFWVEDVDKNGWKDIIAPGKDGLFLFKNFGPIK